MKHSKKNAIYRKEMGLPALPTSGQLVRHEALKAIIVIGGVMLIMSPFIEW